MRVLALALLLAARAGDAHAAGPMSEPVPGSTAAAERALAELARRWGDPEAAGSWHLPRRQELIVLLHRERAAGRGRSAAARAFAKALDTVEREHCDWREPGKWGRQVVLTPADARRLAHLLEQHHKARTHLEDLEARARGGDSRRVTGWLIRRDEGERPPAPSTAELRAAREAWRNLPPLDPFRPIPICRYR